MSRPADVLIVGGGPAGSSLAWRLARAGVGVRLLDAKSFPRSKPCGEALSPGATPLLEELGVRAAVETRGARVAGWRVFAPNGARFEGRFDVAETGSPARGLAIARTDLDALLVERAVAAGVSFERGRRVYRLVWRGERVAGVRARGPDGTDETWPARLVVGADGLRSRVARLLGPVRRGPRRRLALVGRFAGVEWPDDLGELRLAPDGVLGGVPIGRDRCNLTLVVPAGRAAEVSRGPQAFYRSRLDRYGVANRLHAAKPLGRVEVTGPFEMYPQRVVAPGALLLGDAAGYFDPFTGQGIFRALSASRLAAPHLLEALERPGAGADALRAYADAWARLLRPARLVQRGLDAVVFRPALIGRLARTLDGRPGLVSLLLDVTGDRLPPRALWSPARLARARARRGRRPTPERRGPR